MHIEWTVALPGRLRAQGIKEARVYFIEILRISDQPSSPRSVAGTLRRYEAGSRFKRVTI